MNNPHPSPMSLRPRSRRHFLKASLAAATAPLILPARVWSQATAPSRRLTLGVIGIGMIGRIHLANCVQRDDVQFLAVCDVDATRREDAKRRVDEAYSTSNGATYRGCAAYNDFREILGRADIDAVIIATPDHWHALMAMAAVKAGKDVYCEKPLTHNVREALELVAAVRRSNRVFQTGSQQRSSKVFRVAAELVRNGVIGRINSIQVSFGDPASDYNLPAEPMEPGLDWNLWCGPGPLVAYNPALSPRGLHQFYPTWRQTWQFGGGAITNWGAHHIDIAQWALGVDGSGPVHGETRWATRLRRWHAAHARARTRRGFFLWHGRRTQRGPRPVRADTRRQEGPSVLAQGHRSGNLHRPGGHVGGARVPGECSRHSLSQPVAFSGLRRLRARPTPANLRCRNRRELGDRVPCDELRLSLRRECPLGSGEPPICEWRQRQLAYGGVSW